MNSLRVAVVGAGHLGRIHARLAHAADDLELVAVVDPDPTARQRAADETGVTTTESLEQVAGAIDAVILATPTVTHHQLGMDLLSRRLPLLIEKPLAGSLAQADELLDQARRQEVVLQVGHVERFNPALVAVRSELRDPKYIEATRLSGFSFRSTDIGVVFDVMIHDIDIVLSLVNSPVQQVDALGISVLGGHEDMASARLVFESGCVAQFTASRVSFEMRRQMQLFSSRCFAGIDFATGNVTRVQPREDVLRRQFPVEELSPNEVEHWRQHMFDQLLVKDVQQPASLNAIAAEQRDFVESIRSGHPPRVDGQAGRDAVAVAEMILESIEQHAWDGDSTGRRGPHAMPALPILGGAAAWQRDESRYRRAG